MREGEHGECRVRARVDDSIVSTVYGQATGLCVAPVEDAPLFHFRPGSATLSLGTAGCNLSCSFCQAWRFEQADVLGPGVERASPEALAALAERYACRSVSFTYNDPVVTLEQVHDTARACRPRGIATVVVTAGYVCPEARAELFSEVAAASVALKGISETFYARECGGHIEPVLDTLRYLVHETSVWVEVNTVLIPGLNDSDAELGEMASWIADELGPDVPWHLRAFQPDATRAHLPLPPTKRGTLTRARAVARGRGVRHVYTATSLVAHGGDSICHSCGKTLIERGGNHILRYELDDRGRCRACDARCAGKLDGPGGWGAGRVPVSLRDQPGPED